METSEQDINLNIPEEVHSESIKKKDTYPLKIRDEETKPLILIVEDNTDLRNYIRENFEKSYLVLEAVNGQEGMEECIKAIPDLVISDVMMPKMDGFELCKKIKLDERTSHIPVVLLTARASIESKIEGLETGADDYLSKPFNPQELQIRVKNLIQQRSKLQEKFIHDFWKENKSPNLIIPSSQLSTLDKKFLQKALDAVERHISDPDFNIERFGREIGFSRQQMHRKFKALVDQSATEFIRTIRLKKAAELLSKKSGTIGEIAFDVGFNTLSYFTKCFQEQFGVKPSEYPEKYFNK
jgi:DNA-binding response OmpR family regulator